MWLNKRVKYIRKEGPDNSVPTVEVIGNIEKITNIRESPDIYGATIEYVLQYLRRSEWFIKFGPSVYNDLKDRTGIFHTGELPDLQFYTLDKNFELKSCPKYQLEPGDEIIMKIEENGQNKIHDPVIFCGFKYKDHVLKFTYVHRGPRSNRGQMTYIMYYADASEIVDYKIRSKGKFKNLFL